MGLVAVQDLRFFFLFSRWRVIMGVKAGHDGQAPLALALPASSSATTGPPEFSSCLFQAVNLYTVSQTGKRGKNEEGKPLLSW